MSGIFTGHTLLATDLNNYNHYNLKISYLDLKLSTDPELLKFRDQIDRLDTSLLKILAERVEVVKKVGEYKKLNSLPIYQPDRYKELIKRRQKLGSSIGLDEDFVGKLFNLIHDNSVSIQKMLK
ncbi:MAG: chorismate mutase [Solitalea-like symbiont of Tyrophagus putrescentiae]